MMQFAEVILCVGRLNKGPEEPEHLQVHGSPLEPGLERICSQEPEPEDPCDEECRHTRRRSSGYRRRKSGREWKNRSGQDKSVIIHQSGAKEIAVQTDAIPQEIAVQTEEACELEQTYHTRLETIEQALRDLVHQHSQAELEARRKSAPPAALPVPSWGLSQELEAEETKRAAEQIFRMPSGQSWEWPQSREEKKQQVAMLDKQLLITDRCSLLRKLEEIHKHHARRADQVLKSCARRSWDWPMSRQEKKIRVERLEQQAAMVDHSDVLDRLGALLDTSCS